MVSKPWHYTNCRLENHFWKYAKETSVYNLIVNELNSFTKEQKENDELSAKRLVEMAIKESNREDSYYKVMIELILLIKLKNMKLKDDLMRMLKMIHQQKNYFLIRLII